IHRATLLARGVKMIPAVSYEKIDDEGLHVTIGGKASKPGEGLGKTTGWIHRATLLARGVKMIPAVSYEKIDDEGLHVTIGG
ncbi:hypothetical protein C5706_32720, partial [Klebsiella pneumoniae]